MIATDADLNAACPKRNVLVCTACLASCFAAVAKIKDKLRIDHELMGRLLNANHARVARLLNNGWEWEQVLEFLIRESEVQNEPLREVEIK